MSSLIERLRNFTTDIWDHSGECEEFQDGSCSCGLNGLIALLNEAAVEIERLREEASTTDGRTWNHWWQDAMDEVERLRAALAWAHNKMSVGSSIEAEARWPELFKPVGGE